METTTTGRSGRCIHRCTYISTELFFPVSALFPLDSVNLSVYQSRERHRTGGQSAAAAGRAVGVVRRLVASAVLPLHEIPLVWPGEAEPEPQWVLVSVWAHPTAVSRRPPATLLSFVLRSPWSWALVGAALLHSCGLLVPLLVYPAWAVLSLFCVLPLLLFVPSALGALLTFLVTKLGTGGFSLKFGSVRLVPWVAGAALHLQADVEDFAFSNPPDFPTKDFLHASRVSLRLKFPLGDIIRSAWAKRSDIRRWSPFPSMCAELTGYAPGKDQTVCSHPCPKVGTVGVEHVDVSGVRLAFEMHHGLFNISGVTRLLAEGKTFGHGWPSNKREFGRELKGLVELRGDGRGGGGGGYGDEDCRGRAFAGSLHETSPLVEDPERGPSPPRPRASLALDARARARKRPNCLVVKVCSAQLAAVAHAAVVVVMTRLQQHKTPPRKRTKSPVWEDGTGRGSGGGGSGEGGGEHEFLLHVADPSAVLSVVVRDAGSTSSTMVGQWLMTVKFFRIKPDYNYHEKILVRGKNANELNNDSAGNPILPGNRNFKHQVEGRFLLASKHLLNHGEAGTIDLKMSWIYDDRFDPRSPNFKPFRIHIPPNLTALEQLQQNSAETQLRLGNSLLVAQMLDQFPLNVDVGRVTIRDIHFHLGDLFRGYRGANELGQKPQALVIDQIQVLPNLLGAKTKSKRRRHVDEHAVASADDKAGKAAVAAKSAQAHVTHLQSILHQRTTASNAASFDSPFLGQSGKEDEESGEGIGHHPGHHAPMPNLFAGFHVTRGADENHRSQPELEELLTRAQASARLKAQVAQDAERQAQALAAFARFERDLSLMQGVSVWQFLLQFWVHGVAPATASNGSLLAAGSASIIRSGIRGLVSHLEGSTSTYRKIHADNDHVTSFFSAVWDDLANRARTYSESSVEVPSDADDDSSSCDEFG